MLSVIDISVVGKGFDYLSIENKTKPKLLNDFHEFDVDRILHGIFCSDSFPDFSEAPYFTSIRHRHLNLGRL